MTLRIVISIVMLNGFYIALSGCANRNPPSIEASRAGLVYMFPGIEGSPFWLRNAVRGLRDGGLRAEIRIFDWQRPVGGLVNLSQLAANREKAGEVAEQIAEYRLRFPSAPIDLVGYSGGGGMAVFTAEALPEAVDVRTIVLAQAALSPTYDLTAALSRSRAIVNLYCRSDRFTLGLGTRIFGTMDRVYVDSAGQIGFDLERAVPDEAARARLLQHAWDTDALRTGHIGGHVGILGYRWNREIVAPLLRAEDSAPSRGEQSAATSPEIAGRMESGR